MTREKVIRAVVLIEAAGIALVIVTMWLNELIDLPHLLFGTIDTPINYAESVFESALILLLGAVMIVFSWRMVKRVAELERLLPICAVCKKIRVAHADPDLQGSWKPIEQYIADRTGSLFSHGLCPECLEKKYRISAEGSTKKGATSSQCSR